MPVLLPGASGIKLAGLGNAVLAATAEMLPALETNWIDWPSTKLVAIVPPSWALLLVVQGVPEPLPRLSWFCATTAIVPRMGTFSRFSGSLSERLLAAWLIVQLTAES